MQIKVQWPVSVMLAVIVGLAYSSYVYAAITGIIFELCMAAWILVEIGEDREIEVVSLVGWLLRQYAELRDGLDIISIIDNILLRIFCFSLLFYPLFQGTLWLIIPSVLFFLKTCIKLKAPN